MMKMQEEISCEIQPIKTPLLYWFKVLQIFPAFSLQLYKRVFQKSRQILIGFWIFQLVPVVFYFQIICSNVLDVQIVQASSYKLRMLFCSIIVQTYFEKNVEFLLDYIRLEQMKTVTFLFYRKKDSKKSYKLDICLKKYICIKNVQNSYCSITERTDKRQRIYLTENEQGKFVSYITVQIEIIL